MKVIPLEGMFEGVPVLGQLRYNSGKPVRLILDVRAYFSNFHTFPTSN